MTYTPYYAAWHDAPATDTPINAAALQNIENGIAAAVPFGTTTVTGTQSAPIVSLVNGSSQSSLHVTATSGFTAPYLIGVGVDVDNVTGLTVSVKANSDIGIALSLETTSGSTVYGFYGQNLSTGQLMTLSTHTGSTGAVLTLVNEGGTGNLLQWAATTGQVTGSIDSTGKFTALGITRLSDYTLVNTSGASAAGLVIQSNRGSNVNTELRFYRWVGTANQYFPFRIEAGSGAGDEFTISAGASGSTVDGTETVAQAWRMSAYPAGFIKMGFYGATPTSQASRVGQLTDSTGGTVSTTLASGITDSVAKNAIASLAAKVNSIETVLHNIGITA